MNINETDYIIEKLLQTETDEAVIFETLYTLTS